MPLMISDMAENVAKIGPGTNAIQLTLRLLP